MMWMTLLVGWALGVSTGLGISMWVSGLMQNTEDK